MGAKSIEGYIEEVSTLPAHFIDMVAADSTVRVLGTACSDAASTTPA